MGRASPDFPVMLDDKEYKWDNRSYHYSGLTCDVIDVCDNPRFAYIYRNAGQITVESTGLDGWVYRGNGNTEEIQKAIIRDYNGRGKKYIKDNKYGG